MNPHLAIGSAGTPIEACIVNERRASNGSPDFQAPAGITRSLAMQTSIKSGHIGSFQRRQPDYGNRPNLQNRLVKVLQFA